MLYLTIYPMHSNFHGFKVFDQDVVRKESFHWPWYLWFQIAEDFTLVLLPFGDDPAVIGEKNNITITVMANDDPYGIIQFKFDPTIVYVGK